MESLELKQNQGQEVLRKPIALLACYGTLRLNQGNWRGRLRGRSDFLGTIRTTNDFTMYGRGYGFPVVVDKGNTSIVCDIFAVYDENTLNGVHGLEGCTGIPKHPNNWYDIMEIDTIYGKAWMYVMHDGRGESDIIHTGDWLNQEGLEAPLKASDIIN